MTKLFNFKNIFLAIFLSLFVFSFVRAASVNMNLKIDPKGSDVGLIWDKVSTAKNYKVFMDGVMPDDGKIINISTTNYTFKNVDTNSHKYTVQAYATSGNVIGKGEKTYTLTAATPTNGTATPSSGQPIPIGAPFPGETPSTTLPEHLNKVYNWAAEIGSLLATLMIIIAGFKYAASSGNPEALQDAKDTIVGALIGLGIIILSYLLLQIVGARVIPGD